MAAAVLSFTAKIAITINTYGSSDALLWEIDVQGLHDGMHGNSHAMAARKCLLSNIVRVSGV